MTSTGPPAGRDDLRDKIQSAVHAAKALHMSVKEIHGAVTRERLDLLAEADPLMLRDEAVALLVRAERAEVAVERVREWFLQPHPGLTGAELNALSAILNAARAAQPEKP